MSDVLNGAGAPGAFTSISAASATRRRHRSAWHLSTFFSTAVTSVVRRHGASSKTPAVRRSSSNEHAAEDAFAGQARANSARRAAALPLGARYVVAASHRIATSAAGAARRFEASFARAPSSAASQIWSHTKWAAATVGASQVTAARRANTTAVATTRAKSSAALFDTVLLKTALACPPARSSSIKASAAARSRGPWQTAHAAAAR